MNKRNFAVLLLMSIAFLAGMLFARPAPRALAASDTLPPEIFTVGNKVQGPNAGYLIQEIRGGWIRAVTYRSMDGHRADASIPRWLYVPGSLGPWSRIEDQP